MKNKFFLGLFIVLLFSSCVQKEPSVALNVLFKSEELKFKGQGFLYTNKGRLKLELYSLGQFLDSISIGEKICIKGQCYQKKTFNKHFFGSVFYDDLLKDILQCKSIFSKKNYISTEDGFIQKIDDITYEVKNNYCYFKNNLVKIKISK